MGVKRYGFYLIQQNDKFKSNKLVPLHHPELTGLNGAPGVGNIPNHLSADKRNSMRLMAVNNPNKNLVQTNGKPNQNSGGNINNILRDTRTNLLTKQN